MRLPEILQERTEDGRRIEHVGEVQLEGLPIPGRACLLSLIPGLGQIYNGEMGKGALFLAVSLSNLVLLLMLFFPAPVLKGLTDLAALFNFKSLLDINHACEVVAQGRLAVFLYAGLIAMFVAYAMRDARDHAIYLRRGRQYPRFAFTMPEATSGSYLFHFASLISLVVLLVLYVTPPPSREQTTDIELVAQEPPPKPPEPEKKKPDPPKPKVEEPKVVQKPRTVKAPEPKPTPVAVAVPTNDPTPLVQSNEPAPEAAPAPPAAQSGTEAGGEPGGGGGGGGGDGEDIDFGSYLAEVQKRVKKTWFPPRGNESKTVTLKFKIKRDGTLGTIKLVASSGLAIVDQAAQTAVKNASPYPPLPAGSPEEIDVKFTFDYNIFNGKGG